MMRISPIGIAAFAVALTGCTEKKTVIEPAPPPVVYQQPPAPPPVVYQQPPATTGAPRIAYTVIGQQQYDQAATAAASWCSTNYGSTGSRLIDRRPSTAGDVVTFECTTS
jgi:hypothetical protein